ncbi:hypothetical protein C8F04DRAFT_1394200 [Mycena alexandri]|uniref:Uncharacterized protein n=1 Tax=Mycena alexandri TaxID=1745969 RepID=A0AAD6X925_9AGAR|nr:hypothetical protein C8F04DRAFT_1394200 [Mycena alexandri]
MRTFEILFAILLAVRLPLVQGDKVKDEVAYGLCQTGCNNITVACYSAAGLVFGTVIADADAPVAALACNKALSECSSNCTTVQALEPIADADAPIAALACNKALSECSSNCTTVQALEPSA